jgi:hypothetical protein
MREGAFTRFERVALLGIGLITHDLSGENILTPVLWILAVLVSITWVQRLAIVYVKTRDEPPDDLTR